MNKWLPLCLGTALIGLGGLALLDIPAFDATAPHLRSGSHTYLSALGVAGAAGVGLYVLVLVAIQSNRSR